MVSIETNMADMVHAKKGKNFCKEEKKQLCIYFLHVY